MEEEKSQQPLHVVHVDKHATAINRAHLLLHSFLISIFLYHRVLSLLIVAPPLLPCLLLFLAELLLSFIWLCEQAFRWRLVDRAVFIDRLPKDESQMPALDVFICTVDPDKEPTVEVMNTVVSAMALDYPASKLHVYLSDDGGAEVTLSAMKEAWGFATWWVPFCRRYKVECRCPMSYFGGESQQDGSQTQDFFRDRTLVEEKYEVFKRRVEMRRGTDKQNRNDHPPVVQVHQLFISG